MPDNPGIIGLEIRAMRKSCEEMQPYQRNDCPLCAWPLRISVDGIIECIFCGWVSEHQLRRDVPLP
jgi:hypothetical protein